MGIYLKKGFKMLKNYTVKMKNVKYDGLLKYVNYLYSETHKNHSKTEKIISINGNDNYVENMIDLKSKNEKNYILNAKGGRKLQDICKSLTLNVPKNYEANEEQLKKIGLDFHKNLKQYLKDKNIDLENKNVLNVLHKQENNHFHYLLPLLDNEGNTIRYFKEKHFLKKIKVIFSNTVDNVLNTNIKNYNVEKLENKDYENGTIKASKKAFLEKKEKKDADIYADIIKDFENLQKETENEKNIQFYKTTIDLIKRYSKDPNEKLEKNILTRFGKLEKSYIKKGLLLKDEKDEDEKKHIEEVLNIVRGAKKNFEGISKRNIKR
jgi:hypothetical protein